MKKLCIAILAAFALISCDKEIDGEYYFPAEKGSDGSYSYTADASAPGEGSGETPGEGEGSEPDPQHGAGIVTAGEWCDLDNWGFWGGLMTDEGETTTDQEGNEYQREGYARMSEYWKFWTDRRVAVKVSNASGIPQAGVKVKLYSGNSAVWEAVTDGAGRADCWIGMHDDKYQTGTLKISLDGKDMAGAPELTSWSDEKAKLNEYVFSPAKAPAKEADILFIVDATGSMGDEIDFLQDDLLDILNRASKSQSGYTIRTGALFYRDEGDDYLTKKSDFSKNFSTTVNFIKNQHAEGGGDWPEAVHTALEVSLQQFSWNDSARARMAFMLLDAPPHHDHQGVVESVNKSIDMYAAKGIKLIPVAASGIDKDTEFLLRMMAIATEGTYVFITDDSGVGESHLKPTVGKYEIEQLNDLMVRLIEQYLK